jgi:hypothetical protein
MPLDPSIVSNAFANAANNMPDVNALMQQRVQGAENVYQIETARQEQAAQAEKEAAQQAAEAMLPAVASAFSDPSDAGLDAAASMLPPEVSQAFTPFLQRLKGVSDTKQRMAILRAELAKDDEGRYILGQLEPTANMRLQAETAAGSQSLAERRLQLDILKQEAEAAGGGVSPDVAARLEFDREKFEAEKADKATAAASGGMDPKTKAKFDQAYPQAIRNLQSSTTELDKDIADVQALINDEDGLNVITGVYGANTPNISAASRRAQARYDKIRAGAGFSALQAMRDASPTGGALGNVSNQEGAKLEQSVAAFAQNQDADDLRDALRQYLIDLKMAQENVRAAFDETYSYRGEVPSSDIVTQTRERRSQAERDAGKTPLPPGVTVKKRN